MTITRTITGLTERPGGPNPATKSGNSVLFPMILSDYSPFMTWVESSTTDTGPGIVDQKFRIVMPAVTPATSVDTSNSIWFQINNVYIRLQNINQLPGSASPYTPDIVIVDHPGLGRSLPFDFATHHWVRIQQDSNYTTVSMGPDGSSWTQMAQAVRPHNDSSTNTVTTTETFTAMLFFENYSAGPAPNPMVAALDSWEPPLPDFGVTSGGALALRTPTGWAAAGTSTHPLKLRMPDNTWQIFAAGTGGPLYLRSGSSWLKTTTAGRPVSPTRHFTFTYTANTPWDNPRFLGQVGWQAENRDYFEWISPWFGDDSNQRPLGKESYSLATSAFSAGAVSTMGWIGNENSTYYRFSSDDLGWYSLPLGMFIEDAKVHMALNAINNPGSYLNYELIKAEVFPQLEGFGVVKSQVPWMNFYEHAETTISLYPSVGALRFLGSTPPGATQTYAYNNGLYTINVVTNKPFVRETSGEVVWAGQLNDLGVRRDIHGIHGTVNPLPLSQTFTPQLYAPGDSLLYHMQTSILPDPVPIDFNVNGYTTQSSMTGWWKVAVTFQY